MRHKSIILQIFIQAILLIGTPQTVVAAGFRSRDTVYIIGSIGIIRTAPRIDAPIAAKMPIGISAEFIGFPSDVASGPNKECAEADAKGDAKWSCVRFNSLVVDQNSMSWSGWIATDLISSLRPKFEDLIRNYDQTTADNLIERRKWAERAAALDPTNIESQKRLLDVLSSLNDTKAFEAATRSFASYRNGQLRTNGATKLVLVFDGSLLEPIWEFKASRLLSRDFPQDMNFEFRGRGNFYNLYSQGVQTGTVVTDAQFDCRAQICPLNTFGRHITSDGVLATGGGIATTFNLPPKANFTKKLTAQHAATLRMMATTWVTSSTETPGYKNALLQSIEQANVNAVYMGTYTKDGKAMLIGNWVIGSMNDQHYGGDDEIHESLLIIAEQQNDGTFRLAKGSGSISENGCSYFDHLDIDGDGVDEVFLRCDQLEGSYNYSFLKRVNGKWLTPPP